MEFFYTNLPAGFTNFNVIEYPLYTDDSEDEPASFEDQKNQWRIEAEDRFDVQSCNEYNFPAFMMFKIKTFYEYCQEIKQEARDQDLQDETQDFAAQAKEFEDTYCTVDPIKQGDGSNKFPIQDEYLNLGPLGEIFTAYRCPNTARLNELDNVERYTYNKKLQITLLKEAEPELIDLFQILGFQCQEDTQAQMCTVFETKESQISVDSLFKLESYFEKFQSAE